MKKMRVLVSSLLVLCMIFVLAGCGQKELTYDEALSKLITYIEENGEQQSDGSYVIAVDDTNTTPNYHNYYLAKDGTFSVIRTRDENAGLAYSSTLLFEPGNEETHVFTLVMNVTMFADGIGKINGDEIASTSVNGSEYTSDSVLVVEQAIPGLSKDYKVISPETLMAQDGNKYLNAILDGLAALLDEGELGFGIDKLGFTAYTAGGE
ncbi:MAG: hypothetical protein IJH92_06160 [Mogibacterium sp.]|nr:hypothetical protein [Mogibacterium sp.]